ncbi:C39 family peptidase [Rhodococcus tukisamuensis]|uniref:Peptidase_C39 like family protein n=1 Tax=Rhodococcus tukisamuensis TaxID=168276 RepID=A0A1G7B7M6_9NOCA|nr:C39 family peptidase [Rhodococcus tukisamuensis]SDE22847.1 Peptidase_C39 like family protein [Rhodococcus tukisamuensis]
MDDFDHDAVAMWSDTVAAVDESSAVDDAAGPEPIPRADPLSDFAIDPADPAPGSGDGPVGAVGTDDADDGVDDVPDLAGGEDGVHGNPVAWTLDWFYQQFDGYCGPSVVAQVVAQYTGAPITDPQQLVDRAVELGLTDDPSEGMTLPAVETLLEDQGVPCTRTDSSLDDLRDRLDAGYGVIAMVDSGEIWTPGEEADEDDAPDHVLVVAGVDDARGVVILSDPGVPYGNQLEIPIKQFEDAWADSGFEMLVTDAPDEALIGPPAGTTGERRSAIVTLRSARPDEQDAQ